MKAPFRIRMLAFMGAAALVLAACGGDDSDSSDTTAASSDTTAATAGGDPATTAAADSEPSGEVTKMRFALDWTPNTNHTGLYVAQHEGYFTDAGLDVEVLPYNSTSPDVLVGSGAAECGISFHTSLTFSRAAGLPIKSIMAVLQHDATGIGVKADREDIQSPKDLDGKVYAGFGAPGEIETLTQVIKNDGGTGKFDTVTLSTAAYEAVYSGQADFTEPFITWEAIEAELRGTPFKVFSSQDYGFPDEYTVVVICNEDWMADHPDTVRAFAGAMQKGYEYAIANPHESGQMLIDENPGAFSEEELVFKSQELLSSDYFPDADGKFGTQTLEQWTAYSDFLYKQGLLVDENGDTLTEAPDYSAFFTDEYLSAS